MNNTSFSSNSPSGIVANVKLTLYSLILVWSLFGNILVLAVILKNKGLRTNFNFLIINMAVSDILIPILALPIKIADTSLRQHEWLVDGSFGNVLCKLCYFAADISPVVSAFSLVIIAVNRFFAIAVPMQGLLSRRTTLILAAATWIIAIMLLSPYFYTFKLVAGQDLSKCISKWSPAFDDSTAEKVFNSIIIVVVFVFPCITITILYSVMMYKLRLNSNKVAYMLNNKQYRRRQRRNKSIFIMTVVIMVLYFVLWGPFFFTVFILNFSLVEINNNNKESVKTAIATVQILAYLNSAANPSIYFYFLRNLRQGLKKLLLRIFLLQKTESLTFRSSRASAKMKKRSNNSYV